jgi:16S rRNA (guanine527-N7)-methyltransferase
VAALSKLIPWCWPLVNFGGQILMIKGQSALEEIEEASSILRRKKLQAKVLQAGSQVVDPPITVIQIVKIPIP